MRAEILRGPERRRRWTVEQKLAMVRAAEEPGVRLCDVARRFDVSRQQLYHWRAAARSGRLTEGGSEPRFLQIEMAGSGTAAGPAPHAEPAREAVVEIGLSNGRSLKVPSSLSMPELRRLIRAVEGA
jgi:transposase